MAGPQRITDYQMIADTASNKEAIANIKEDLMDVKDDVREIKEILDELKSVIAAQSNRLIGASWLAKFLWLGFPTASSVFTYIAMRKVGV